MKRANIVLATVGLLVILFANPKKTVGLSKRLLLPVSVLLLTHENFYHYFCP